MEKEENVYEVTDNILKGFSNDKSGLLESSNQSEKIQKEDLIPGNKAFLLRNFLSEKECLFYIQQAEQFGLTDVADAGYRSVYRDNLRVVAKSAEIAQTLYERARPYLDDVIHVTPQNQKEFYPGTKGQWEPIGLNDHFRICRYNPGGHFAPHYDGEFVATASVRSFKTFMIYLNGDFEGGTTNFVSDEHQLHKDPVTGKYQAEEDKILFRIKPEMGMAIVFNHRLLHEGSALKTGMKYIMRTEAMFKLINREIDERENTFQMMIQKAQELEAFGKVNEAVQIYSKASKLYPDLAVQWGI